MKNMKMSSIGRIEGSANTTRNTGIRCKWSAAVLALLLLLTLAGCTTGQESDAAAVQAKGTLVVGITEFAPMDYQDTSGNWIGFDADMAKAFANSLGVEAEFIVIDWDSKIMELNNRSIDVVWNGMTLDDGVCSAMSTSDAYCKNAQVVVLPAEKKELYSTADSLQGLTFAVESGSAGESQAKAAGWNVTPVQSQADALKEVAAGTSDAAIIDLLMAGAMIGEGTSYPGLICTVSLNEEEYGVGFRKGSDLTEKLNAFFKEAAADGSMMELAKTYGVQESVILN